MLGDGISTEGNDSAEPPVTPAKQTAILRGHPISRASGTRRATLDNPSETTTLGEVPHRLLFALAVAVVAAGTVLFGWPGPLRPPPPRIEGSLIFQGRDDDGYGIFTIGADGEHLTAVPIPIARSIGFPRYSPDGGAIAFIAESEDGVEDLYVAAADGSSPRVLAPSLSEPEGAPSWAPDGETIAFASRRDGNWEIYSVGRDGTGLTRLTDHDAFDAAPAWAPDGSGRIAFSSDRGGVDSHVYLMRSDGSDVTQLTFGDDEAVPDWSPDASSIAYAGFSGGNADIWVIDADGTDARRLGSDPLFEYTPRWSPDGRWIAFEAYLADTPDLFVMDPAGDGRRRLTASGRYAGAPAWMPAVPT